MSDFKNEVKKIALQLETGGRAMADLLKKVLTGQVEWIKKRFEKEAEARKNLPGPTVHSQSPDKPSTPKKKF